MASTIAYLEDAERRRRFRRLLPPNVRAWLEYWDIHPQARPFSRLDAPEVVDE